MLTPAGTKLLDFGLAKNTIGPAGQALSELATAPGTATAQGTILGTLPYMAPEQVQGQPADARTDLFALGTILHEMATGRRAFEATTQASLIAKILETEPPVVSSLAPLTPPALDHVVQGCLAKAPADRWQTAHDVKMQLQWIQAQGSRIDAGTVGGDLRKRAAWVPWVRRGGASAALAATALLRSSRPVATRQRRRSVSIWSCRRRCGRRTTIAARSRRMGSGSCSKPPWMAASNWSCETWPPRHWSSSRERRARFDPFWSPDSRSVAFFARRRPPQTGPRDGRTRTSDCRRDSAIPAGPIGATWRDGVILFAPGDGRIYRVADTGGTATAARDASVEARTEALRVSSVSS